MNTTYDVDYFIAKFEAIPEAEWTIKIQQDSLGRRCAFGQCMPDAEKINGEMTAGYGAETPQGEALACLFIKNGLADHRYASISAVAEINNGDRKSYQQPTPKQRILAALMDIKANQAVAQAQEIIKEDSPEKALMYQTV